jgi:hypothetical protein
MVNLMYLTKPNRVKKIDVMDFIYREIKFGVEEKRAPAYAPFIQAFINHVAGEKVMEAHAVKEQSMYTPIFTRGPMLPEHGKNKGVQEESPNASPRPIKKTHKPKDSKWKKAIKSIFLMCKSADAHAFNANERSKRMAREANARRRAQGEHVVDSSSLEPSVLVEYEDPFTSGEEEVQSRGGRATRDDIPSASSGGSESYSEY